MEKVVFYREKASDMYSSMTYVITQIGVEIPYMFIQVFIFSAIVYPMAGFQLTVTKFFWFVVYMILSFTDYTLYGMMMAVALTPSIEIASGLSFLIFMIWNVFSGFIVSRKILGHHGNRDCIGFLCCSQRYRPHDCLCLHFSLVVMKRMDLGLLD